MFLIMWNTYVLTPINSKVAYIYRLQIFLSLQTQTEWVLGGLGCKIATGGVFSPPPPPTPNASALRGSVYIPPFAFLTLICQLKCVQQIDYCDID